MGFRIGSYSAIERNDMSSRGKASWKLAPQGEQTFSLLFTEWIPANGFQPQIFLFAIPTLIAGRTTAHLPMQKRLKI